VIGGVGGSGTRVVAKIIEKIGVYIGNDLNPAKDNLWFLLLFKRPQWYRKVCQDKAEIFTGLNLFSRSMFDNFIPTGPELRFLMHAVFEIAISGHNYQGDGRGVWPFVRAFKMLTMRQKASLKHVGWGWKEPNTHIYLEYIAEYFENLKYIHTIRHGLDMAFSRNQQQLYNWGTLFGVQLPKSKTEEPRASLKYWVKSNQRALGIGNQLGNEKFLVVNFDTLCAAPEPEIQRMVSFLNIKARPESLQMASNIPKRPTSFGRHQAHDLSQFEPADIAALKAFGFSPSATAG
jgi:hypothetical protein